MQNILETSSLLKSRGHTCPDCGEFVPRVYNEQAGMWMPQLCMCPGAVAHRAAQSARYEAAKAAREERERQRLESIRLDATGIMPELRDRTFARFTPDSHQMAGYGAALQFVEAFTPGSGRGLLYWAPSTGTGKTHLALAIALALHERGYRVRFGTLIDLLDRLRATFAEGATETEYEVLAEYRECDLLVIDDIGREKVTAWTEAKVYQIVNDRWARRRPIVGTTNLEPPLQMIEQLTRPVYSRLSEMCQFVPVLGEDWRLKRQGGER